MFSAGSISIADLSKQTPKIMIKFNNVYINALADTGASVNLISSQFFSELPNSYKQIVKIGCGTVEMDIHGIFELEYTVLDVTLNSKFLIVPNLSEECILGYPWFLEQQVVLDTVRSCMYFGKNIRRTIYFANGTPPSGTVINNISLNHLDDLIKDQYEAILDEYSYLFDESLKRPVTRTIEHDIRLNSNKPIKIKPYPLSEHKKRIMNEQIQEMLSAGVIESSISPYSSSPVIIERPDKKPRFCVDYRALNQVTEDEFTKLPKVHETLKELGVAKIFTSLDLRSGYWQVGLSERSKPLTAFSTPDGGHYQFTVMPFGLKNAPTSFQKLMSEEVLTGFLHKFALVYLDDIIVYSRNHEEHLKHLHLILERLSLHGLQISQKKCHIAKNNLNFLGHHIKGDCNTPQEYHLNEILNYPTPKNKKQLQSFIGTINWLREYVFGLSILTAPLVDLLCKKAKWKWTEVEQRAFDATKNAFSQPLKLHRPDPTLPFLLQTDASDLGMGAVLFQEGEGGKKQVISYSSARLNMTERKYHINEKECLCIVWAIKKYRQFLEDRKFKLITDNRALLWLNKYRDSKAKLTRWSLLLSEFNFDIEHCPGKLNLFPDFLSRNARNEQTSLTEYDMSRLIPPENRQDQKFEINNSNLIHLNYLAPIDDSSLYKNICLAQTTDPELRQKVSRWNFLQSNLSCSSNDRQLLNNYLVKDDLLFKQDTGQVIVPTNVIERVLYFYHDSPWAGHPGRDEMFNTINQYYYWSEMRSDISKYTKNCLVCLSVKGRNLQQSATMTAHVATNPGEIFSIDIMGPYPKTGSGCRFLITVEDLFTRWVEAKPVPTVRSKDIIHFLNNEVCCRLGYPKTIISDNGTQFMSENWKNFCKEYHINHVTSPIYHQRANPVERRNQEIKKVLKAQLFNKNTQNWDKRLPRCLFCLRNRTNAATGLSPAMSLLGYSLSAPGERDHPKFAVPVINRGHMREQRLQKARENQEAYQGKYTNGMSRHPTFQSGDQVLVRSMTTKPGEAFNPAWEGPFTIISPLSEAVYIVSRNGVDCKIHIDDIRPIPPEQLLSFQKNPKVGSFTSVSSEELEEENREYGISPQSSNPDMELENVMTYLDRSSIEIEVCSDNSSVSSWNSDDSKPTCILPDQYPKLTTRTRKAPIFLNDYVCN